jgi:DNA relaxase NicK
MQHRIDWLSWTMPIPHPIGFGADLYNAAKAVMKGIGNDYAEYLFNGTAFENAAGRAPYRMSLARADHGLFIYGGGHQSNILFELTGRGCGALDNWEDATGFISGFRDSLTRLDFASDVRSSTSPSSFVNGRTHQGFRSLSYIKSATGETCYVGSPKSDRFARVYRYNHPHPRSELLRCEHVFRRKLARSAFQALQEAGSFEAFAASVGATFGWGHSDWKPGHKSKIKLTVPKVERVDENTVHWLYTQVAPAMSRLYRQGALDVDEFLNHMLSIGQEEPEVI